MDVALHRRGDEAAGHPHTAHRSRQVPRGNDLIEERDEFCILGMRKQNVTAVVEDETFARSEGSSAAAGYEGLVDQRERQGSGGEIRIVGYRWEVFCEPPSRTNSGGTCSEYGDVYPGLVIG